MSDLKYVFRPQFARRIPDPTFKDAHGLERHMFVVPVRDFPGGLPLDPNARRPKTSKRVYQKVRESLLNEGCEPNTFHLKNKGITIVAKSVRQRGNHEYEVTMTSGIHGIVDGGHTYQIILENQDSLEETHDQYVNVEVRVGVPDMWVPEIASGLNTSVQVQDMSLDHLAGLFEWMKNLLANEPYYNVIAWSENDPGDFDARDIVSLMTAFNVALYPNESDDHPVHAYEKKSTALKEYEENIGCYQRMSGILKDILRFHDIIRLEAREIWNEKTGGKAAALAFMEKRKKGKYKFPFIQKEASTRMMSGALYPLLAAFRWYVVVDPSGKLQWKHSFDDVIEAWREVGHELMRTTLLASNELGRNPNAIGKSRNHWANLHARVAKFDLMATHMPVSEAGEKESEPLHQI